MLYKPLVSLAVAFIATSSVAASATPIRRGGGGLGPGYGPNSPASPPTINQCDGGTVQCCDGSGMNCDGNTVILGQLGSSNCGADKTVSCCRSNSQSTVAAVQCVPIILNL